MLATLIGSYCVHRPPGPRKVGIPLSAEMPAPVRATARWAPASSLAARWTLTPARLPCAPSIMRIVKRRLAVVAAIAALLMLAVAGTSALLSSRSASRVLLTVFVGVAEVAHGSVAAEPARSGDMLGDGDSITTGADSKASLTYPDGSVTRLDSSTSVVVHVTQSGASLRTRLV